MQGDDALNNWLKEAWGRRAGDFSISVEGAAIAFRGWNIDAVDLPGIVLVHGFRAHSHWWDHIAPALSDTHRVVALDLSGMGDSGRRAEYLRSQFGREILAVAAAAHMDQPIVVAHSFGATAAILAARASPDRVGRLIVIDSAIPLQETSLTIRMPAERVWSTREEAIARFYLRPAAISPVPAILDYVASHSVMERSEGWGWKFDGGAAATLNHEQYRNAMFGVTVRVDAIYGELTQTMTPAHRRQLREMAPIGSDDIAIPAARHHIMIEQPIALVTALRALLADKRG